MDQEKRQHLEKLMEEHHKRLRQLQLKEAKFGSLHVPEHIPIEIEELEQKIDSITEQLAAHEGAPQESKHNQTQQSHEKTFDTYVGHMDNLLAQGLQTSVPDNWLRSMARTRTLDALRTVDARGKARIIQFLYNTRLIGYAEWPGAGVTTPSVIDLHEADLSGINFPLEKFVGIDLSGAYLIDVNFNYAELQYAHFQDTFIANSSFRYAHLQCSHFERATLQEDTDLTLADFRRACFRAAKLSDVKLFYNYFHRADFTDAWIPEANFTSCILDNATFARCDVTFEQLDAASSLHGTQLPGTIIGTDFGDKWSDSATT